MTDIRRTLLWGIFLASLFFIYESWNRHNGQPSLLGTPAPAIAPVRTTVPGAPVIASSSNAVPGGLPGAATPAAPAAIAPSAVATTASAVAPAGQVVNVTTDLVRATIDSTGATLTRIELLKQADPFDHTKNVVLLDRSASRLYLAESGLVPPAGGAGLPNHHTPMHVLDGERTLQPNQGDVKVVFESDPVGGVKLVKTYAFKRGDYVIGVKNEVVNESGAAVNPRLYLQLVRDGNAPAGESSFYFTFTGPSIYDDAAKYKKIDFKSIEKRRPDEKPDHEVTADNGWVAMVQHYFASAWLIDKPGVPAQPREFFTGKVAPNTYSVGMLVPLGDVAPGASKAFDAQLFIGPQEEDKLAALAPGRERVKDYGYFTILAKPLFWLLTQLHRFLGNWGWSIVGLVLYWLTNNILSIAQQYVIN